MKKDKKNQPFTISNLKFLIEKGRLNFNPRYQRGFVWKASQKELLIDSLILGYDVPKLYFHDNPEYSAPDIDFQYDVVDGQQRLRTIQGFLEGEVKLPKEADDYKGEVLKSKKFDDLSDDLQMEFLNMTLDIVILNDGYVQEDIEDMFSRFNNGEPLNAPEKRNSLPGNFKNVVNDLANSSIFLRCILSKRGGAADAVAKILHVRINGSITGISAPALRKRYLDNQGITDKSPFVLETKRALNFLGRAFKASNNPDPRLKKWAILTLAEVAAEMNKDYALKDFEAEFANAFLKFEAERIANNELDDSEQDSTYSEVTNATRGDSQAFAQFRFDKLRDFIIREIEELPLKDSQRAFTLEQRQAIYHLGGGVCANSNCQKEVEFSEFHADHVLPFVKGGETKLSNGQVLCAPCNLKKSASVQDS